MALPVFRDNSAQVRGHRPGGRGSAVSIVEIKQNVPHVILVAAAQFCKVELSEELRGRLANQMMYDSLGQLGRQLQLGQNGKAVKGTMRRNQQADSMSATNGPRLATLVPRQLLKPVQSDLDAIMASGGLLDSRN